jgi:hypothetical protein
MVTVKDFAEIWDTMLTVERENLVNSALGNGLEFYADSKWEFVFFGVQQKIVKFYNK